MDNNDKQEFVRVLNGLAAIKRVELTEEAYEMWWLSMKDWTLPNFTAAAGFLLKNCQFMPAPNDFEDLRKKSAPSAHEAWAKAYAACMGWRIGEGSGDTLIDSVVSAMGGYREIALCDKGKLPFMERRFVEMYRDFSEGDHARKALPDVTEAPRISNGSAIQIGDILSQRDE